MKKLDEIKEAISTSTTSTPVKMLTGDRLAAGDVAEGENESTDGSEGGERHRRISAEFGSYRGSYANLKDFEDLPENLFPTPNEFPTGKFSEVQILFLLNIFIYEFATYRYTIFKMFFLLSEINFMYY